MKKKLLTSVKPIILSIVIALFSIQLNAQSYTLTTVPPYTSNNGSSAITFNVLAGSSDILVTQVACAFSAASTNVQVWYITSPINGTPSVATPAWTLAGTVASLTNSTLPTPTPIPLTLNITIPAGQTYGFCVTSGGSLQYLTGTVTPTQISDPKATIINDPNVGFGGVMNTGWIANRQFCGSITYQLAAPAGPGIPPIAGFVYNILTDTVWINSPNIFTNISNNSLHAYWDVTGYCPTAVSYTHLTLPTILRV